jgi:hypothetical protein
MEGDRNVIQMEAEKKLKYKNLKYRNSANVEHDMLCHTSNHWGHGNYKQKFKKSGNNIKTTCNRYSTKTAVLRTSHTIRKALQSETGSVSGGVHHWFKRRGTSEKKTCDKRTTT